MESKAPGRLALDIPGVFLQGGLQGFGRVAVPATRVKEQDGDSAPAGCVRDLLRCITSS